MSDERFTWKTEKLQHLDDEVIIVVDNANKEWKGHVLNVIDLLNSLAEENEQLKQQIKIEKKWQLEKDRYYVKIKEENDQLRRLFEEMKQPITINLTEEDEKELRKLLGLIDDE